MVVLLIVVDVDLSVAGELIRIVARDSMREEYNSQQKRLTNFSLYHSCFLNPYVYRPRLVVANMKIGLRATFRHRTKVEFSPCLWTQTGPRP